MSALSFANMLFPDEYSVSGQLHRVTARAEVATSGQANLPDHRVSFFAVETPGETFLTPTALSKVGNFLLRGRGTRGNPGTRDQCGPILLQPYSIGTITLAWSTRWPRRSPNAFSLLRRCGRSRTASTSARWRARCGTPRRPRCPQSLLFRTRSITRAMPSEWDWMPFRSVVSFGSAVCRVFD